MTDTEYDIDLSEVGVPRGEGESWDNLAERLRRERRPSFDCALCGEWHDSRGDAVRCCSERFGPVDADGESDDVLEGST